MTRADLIGGLGLTIVGLVLIFFAIPYGTTKGQYFGLPPTFFPTLIATCLTLAAAALTVQAIARRRRESTPRPLPVTGWNMAMLLLASALALGGVIAIDHFGIVYAGPALIAAFMLFLGERGIVRSVLTSTVPVAAVYVLALHVLRTPLP